MGGAESISARYLVRGTAKLTSSLSVLVATGLASWTQTRDVYEGWKTPSEIDYLLLAAIVGCDVLEFCITRTVQQRIALDWRASQDEVYRTLQGISKQTFACALLSAMLPSILTFRYDKHHFC